jgi:branched-chain amino acid transport system substrate-binding protein
MGDETARVTVGPTRRGFLTATGAGIIAASGALGPFVSRGVAADPIKIGYPTNRSGVYAYLGAYEIMGAQLAVEEYNQQGGVLGRPLEMILEDTQANPAVAVQKATKLLDRDRVVCLVGGILSAEAFALGDLAQQRKVVYINTAGNNDGQRCHRYVFAIDHSMTQMAKALVPWLAKNRGHKWYFVNHSTPAAQFASDKVGGMLKAAGGTVLGVDSVPLETTDFSAHLNKVKAAAPDLAFFCIGGIPLVNLLKQFKEFGLRGKIEVSGYTINQSDSWNMGIDTFTGTWAGLWYYKQKTKGSPEFTARFTKKFGKPPENNSWQGYFGIRTVVEAMKSAGSTDGKALVEAIEKMKFDGYKGRPLYYRALDHQLMQPLYIMRAKKREEAEDEWDHFAAVAETPGPTDDLESIAGTPDEMPCKGLEAL